MSDKPNTSGMNLGALDNHGEDPGGTGGQSGGGAAAGAGQPAGGMLGSERGEAGAPVREPGASPPRDSLAGITGDEVAGEAAALGAADGELARAAGMGGARQGLTPTGGEALGAGAGRGEPGQGTPGERGETGGGDPMR